MNITIICTGCVGLFTGSFLADLSIIKKQETKYYGKLNFHSYPHQPEVSG